MIHGNRTFKVCDGDEDEEDEYIAEMEEMKTQESLLEMYQSVLTMSDSEDSGSDSEEKVRHNSF